MVHAVLLGDSIFDNATYVPDGLSVQEHLRVALDALDPDQHQVLLLAVDGDYITDVHDQIRALPVESTHLFLSVGGNDALRYAAQLQSRADSVAAALAALAEMKTEFNYRYGELLKQLSAFKKPLTVCTIYDQASTQDPGLRLLAFTALSLFNDCITRQAIQYGLPLIDLRLVCSDPGDYSAVSPIEPSHQGGQKIAQRIVTVISQHDKSIAHTVCYA
ncbi:SGNH/GDSL hydrolase family protein [Nodosilinea sp. E11]|uniref:SGNH/GDSL hydrolase family protein n=1 Tax=Nodosilinea sp. E11 TaxID=3037479 RepID=UPI002934B078|nr:SGNH/GDSL hydrolase family protein [Nodosilinea sp. E11]WOD37203.1 SGNH/GDSL hydrolase family protein [Nodosilinea sp. E11]